LAVYDSTKEVALIRELPANERDIYSVGCLPEPPATEDHVDFPNPGDLFLCSQDNFKGTCTYENAQGKCRAVGKAAKKSVIQYKGAICTYHNGDDCSNEIFSLDSMNGDYTRATLPSNYQSFGSFRCAPQHWQANTSEVVAKSQTGVTFPNPGDLFICKDENFLGGCTYENAWNRCRDVPGTHKSMIQYNGAMCTYFAGGDCSKYNRLYLMYSISGRKTMDHLPEHMHSFGSFYCEPQHEWNSNTDAKTDTDVAARSETGVAIPTPGDLFICKEENYQGGCVYENAMNKCRNIPGSHKSQIQYKGARCKFYSQDSCKGNTLFTWESGLGDLSWQRMLEVNWYYKSVECVASTGETFNEWGKGQ
jgi:hypothetical protein